MKKFTFIALVLLLSYCASYDNYVKNYQTTSIYDVYDKFNEWIDNPEQVIVDLAPFAIDYPDYIVGISGDTIFIELSEFQIREKERVKEIEAFNTAFYNFDVKEFAKNFYADSGYRMRVIYSSIDNMLYSFTTYYPFFFTASKFYTDIPEGYVLYATVTKQAVKKIIHIDGMEVYLTEGSRTKGFKHILKHTPQYWKNLEKQAPPNTNLFLLSDEQYILNILDKFQRAKIYEIPTEYPYLCYDAKVLCDVGIERNYRLIVNSRDNTIITFYPTNKVGRMYLTNKYLNYITLKY